MKPMQDSSLNNKVKQTMEAFESIAPLQTSEQWSDSLMSRIETSGTLKNQGFSAKGPVLLAVLFLLLNAGYVVIALRNTNNASASRSEELKQISEELLINPSSLNN